MGFSGCEARAALPSGTEMLVGAAHRYVGPNGWTRVETKRTHGHSARMKARGAHSGNLPPLLQQCWTARDVLGSSTASGPLLSGPLKRGLGSQLRRSNRAQVLGEFQPVHVQGQRGGARTWFRPQKAAPWCGQSHASEGCQERRSRPRPPHGSGEPVSCTGGNQTRL